MSTNVIQHVTPAKAGVQDQRMDSRLRGNDRRAFSILWRVAILALPWQTRWFAAGVSLGGWPWEQGRWSFYASWILIAATIVVGLRIEERKTFEKTKRDGLILLGGLFLCSLAALVLNPETSVRFPAIAEWWIQVVLLGAFVWTLWKADVSFRSLAEMFVLSLLPHVALGFWQYAIQYVAPMKWLGIAAQDPRMLGVSVVEAGLFRVLRIYGGFPHPNIFGAWLAVGVVVSTGLASHAGTKRRAIALTFATALLSLALFLTFARSAWIAAVAGIVLLAVRVGANRCVRPVEDSDMGQTHRSDMGQTHRSAPTSFQFFFLTIVSAALLVGIVGFTQRHLFFARIQSTERIEVKSLDERKQSLVDGVNLFRLHPMFGTGPNGELVDLVRTKLPSGKTRLLEPAEPPHDAFLLFFDDFGTVGVLLASWLIVRRRASFRQVLITDYWLLVPFFILSLFDHYFLSFWAGQVLTGFVLLLVLAEA